MRGCLPWLIVLVLVIYLARKDPTIVHDLRNWIDEILLWIEKLDLQSWKLT